MHSISNKNSFNEIINHSKIFIAIEAKNESKVDMLLTAHPELINKNLKGETLLSFACKNECSEIVKLLISKGAEIQKAPGVFYKYVPALRNAALTGDLKSVELLIEHGIFIDDDTIKLAYADTNEKVRLVGLVLQAHKFIANANNTNNRYPAFFTNNTSQRENPATLGGSSPSRYVHIRY